MYRQKYLKYVAKHINGGAGEARTFHVFTTGLISWNLDENCPWFYFLDHLLEKICDIVFADDRYVGIHVYSYDPHIHNLPVLPAGGAGEESERATLSRKIEDGIAAMNEKIAMLITGKFTDKTISFEHYDEFFNGPTTIADKIPGIIDFNKKYIIIDAAHLFGYTGNIHEVVYSGYYNTDTSVKYNLVSVYGNYFGYPSSPDDFNSKWINSVNFFKINPDETVMTYHDMMILLGYTLVPKQLYPTSPPQLHPMLNIEDIYNRIKAGIIAKFDGDRRRKCLDIFPTIGKEITEQIIERIMIGVTETELIGSIIDEYTAYCL